MEGFAKPLERAAAGIRRDREPDGLWIFRTYEAGIRMDRETAGRDEHLSCDVHDEHRLRL